MVDDAVADLLLRALAGAPGVEGTEWRSWESRVALIMECGCVRVFRSSLGQLEAVLDAARWYVRHLGDEKGHEPRGDSGE